MIASTRTISPTKAFWTVILTGQISTILIVFLMLWRGTFQDFAFGHELFQILPERLYQTPIMSVLVGTSVLLIYHCAALIAAGILATILAAGLGKVPFWPFIGALPLYAALIH